MDVIVHHLRSVETAADEPKSPEFSDDALALEFVRQTSRQLRYVAKWGRWLRWDSTVWREDDTLLVFDSVRQLCRKRAAAANSRNTTIASAKTVAAVERLARSDRRVAATSDQWDADPWLLNTPEGTIDLRTAELRSNRWQDYITKSTTVAPDGGCPLFMKFLDRIAGGDKELQRYLQRVFGYALTGSTQEQAMFFFYGTGANGKSVLLNTISRILGDYTTGAPTETFTASKITSDRHPADLAKMRGARLVTAVETEEGRFWAEAKIKALTGGDKITARFMRGNYFDFTPAFKLVIAGNHKPRIKTVDEAIRRRFNLVPFAVTIPDKEQDPELDDKLMGEWPGILQWMVDGCIEWQELGTLAPPQSVLDATAEYLEGEDAMASWLDECCDVDPAKADNSTTLYESWKAWADHSNEYCGTHRNFSQKLEVRGFERRRDGRIGIQFIGLAAKTRKANWTDV